jgi:hypothetical protein
LLEVVAIGRKKCREGSRQLRPIDLHNFLGQIPESSQFLGGLCFHLMVADNSEFHSFPVAFGHMSPHCRFSHLGPFRLRIFPAQLGNGDESNPLEISMSSAMKGKPGLATGLTTLGALLHFIGAWKSSHRNLCQARIELGPGPHPLLTALPRE